MKTILAVVMALICVCSISCKNVSANADITEGCPETYNYTLSSLKEKADEYVKKGFAVPNDITKAINYFSYSGHQDPKIRLNRESSSSPTVQRFLCLALFLITMTSIKHVEMR